MKLQTLLPTPSVAQYQDNASNAAGFSLTWISAKQHFRHTPWSNHTTGADSLYI
jgi:hypothetical protein